MSWVALDRGIKIAQHFHKEQVFSRWNNIRNEIQEDILKNGWNDQVQAFTQFYGSKEMDASLLLMPYFGFLEPTDNKIKKTVENISKNLITNGLVYRYLSHDDFGLPENGFLACNFWLADALFLTGEKEEAIKLFEKTLKYSNHLGLFSEHIKPETYEQTGNFPQAYTHIALINTATLLTQNEIRKPVCKLKLEV
jgi:GH15 family glucan-1,4-alpha-glucosidase